MPPLIIELPLVLASLALQPPSAAQDSTAPATQPCRAIADARVADCCLNLAIFKRPAVEQREAVRDVAAR